MHKDSAFHQYVFQVVVSPVNTGFLSDIFGVCIGAEDTEVVTKGFWKQPGWKGGGLWEDC